MTKKKPCKNICMFCTNIRGRDEEIPVCSEYVTNGCDCVTGGPIITYAPCKEKNKDGCCKKYTPDKERLNIERLRQDLKRFKKAQLNTYGHHDESIVEFLVKQLLDEIEDKDSDFYRVYSSCGDYDVKYKYNPDEGYKYETKAYKEFKKLKGDSAYIRV